jgi:hypothetical protein
MTSERVMSVVSRPRRIVASGRQRAAANPGTFEVSQPLMSLAPLADRVWLTGRRSEVQRGRSNRQRQERGARKTCGDLPVAHHESCPSRP